MTTTLRNKLLILSLIGSFILLGLSGSVWAMGSTGPELDSTSAKRVDVGMNGLATPKPQCSAPRILLTGSESDVGFHLRGEVGSKTLLQSMEGDFLFHTSGDDGVSSNMNPFRSDLGIIIASHTPCCPCLGGQCIQMPICTCCRCS